MFNVALLRLMFFCGGFWRKFGVQSHRVCCHWMSGPSIVAVMGVVKVWCGRAFPPVFNSSDYQLLCKVRLPCLVVWSLLSAGNYSLTARSCLSLVLVPYHTKRFLHQPDCHTCLLHYYIQFSEANVIHQLIRCHC